MNIIDVVEARQLEDGDNILYGPDVIEDITVLDHSNPNDETGRHKGGIWVKGYSHVQGDRVTYILDPFTEVSLWEA